MFLDAKMLHRRALKRNPPPDDRSPLALREGRRDLDFAKVPASRASGLSGPSPYSTARWRRERLEQLRNKPLCLFCAELGRKTPATVVDHIRPWRGNLSMFWDSGNWQSLCRSCHDSTKQRLEKSGHLRGGDARGLPLDPAHHWNLPA